MHNPILIEVTRGRLAESAHAGAVAVGTADGALVASVGNTGARVFPRSAVKALQALPLVETGAADRFGFGAAEIAIAGGSHAGTEAHVAVVSGMLARAGLDATALACGVHEPMDRAATDALVRAGKAPSPLHHNCSGKHAGMLATAVHMREPIDGYWRPDHPVQRRIARVLETLTGHALAADACGIDGCSVPNWAIPLEQLARAFARFGTGNGLEAGRAAACRRVAEAYWAEPVCVAGPGRLDTIFLERLPGKVLIKAGAEGVYCGALPEQGLGFAVKIDDGAKRAAEAVSVRILERFYAQARGLGPAETLRNWRGLEVGQLRASAALETMLAELARGRP